MTALKLFGMAQAIAALAEQRGPAFQKAQPLLKAEVAEREVRSINYHMKAAKFPAYRDLSGFTFADNAVDETRVKTLHSCAFIEDAHNVVFIGGPGTGKTHLATAIGVQAIMRHQLRVRCFSAIELVNQLESEKTHGKPGKSPTGSSMQTSLSSTNSATCRSHRPAGRCCSIC